MSEPDRPRDPQQGDQQLVGDPQRTPSKPSGGTSPRRPRVWWFLLLLVPLALLDWSAIWGWVAYDEPEPIVAGFEVAFLRADFLPGKPHRVPVQPCPACQRGGHARCVAKTKRIELNLDFSKRGNMRLDYVIKSERMDDEFVTVAGQSFVLMESFLLGETRVDAQSFECPCCEPGG